MGRNEASEKGTYLTTRTATTWQKLEAMILELDLQSPYTPAGEPRQDLPTGEVLAWDGKEWAIGRLTLELSENIIWLLNEEYSILLLNVVRFAPLPTIIEEDDLL